MSEGNPNIIVFKYTRFSCGQGMDLEMRENGTYIVSRHGYAEKLYLNNEEVKVLTKMLRELFPEW